MCTLDSDLEGLHSRFAKQAQINLRSCASMQKGEGGAAGGLEIRGNSEGSQRRRGSTRLDFRQSEHTQRKRNGAGERNGSGGGQQKETKTKREEGEEWGRSGGGAREDLISDTHVVCE